MGNNNSQPIDNDVQQIDNDSCDNVCNEPINEPIDEPTDKRILEYKGKSMHGFWTNLIFSNEILFTGPFGIEKDLLDFSVAIGSVTNISVPEQ